MTLTNRQKQIVNPFASTFDSPERRGVGYDYESPENRFALDAIHEKYIYFFEFPVIGTTLRGLNREPASITRDDMLAYFALYPQNGKVVDNAPVEVSSIESQSLLNIVAITLENQGSLKKYSSSTTELTFDEERSGERASNLVAIPPAHSKPYRDKLRFALDLPEVQYGEQEGLAVSDLDPEVATYVNSDTNLDLYDWRKNGLPGEDNDRVYYNPVDRHYYYVRRTSETNDQSYAFNSLRNTAKKSTVAAAIATWSRYSDEKKQRYIFSLQTGIREILKLTGRNSQENYEKLSRDLIPPTSYANISRELTVADSFPLLTYKDIRPGSRWIYALKIDASQISSLQMSPASDRLADLRPSFEEFEIPILDKAQRLIGQENRSFTSVSFKVSDMVRYLLPVRSLLRQLGANLFDEGLTPDVIGGIDLEREASRLESFFELLELFCSYNKLALNEDDLVEIFFTSNYLIDHVVINGNFYYQGCGANKYFDITSEVTRVVNAFSLFTPTTFSILKNSYEIYNQAQNQQSTTINSLDFIAKYIYPTPDIGALKIKRINARSKGEKISSRRNDVFTKLTSLSKTSPAQYERLFQTRSQKYRISSTLNAINCNSGQYKAAKYALKFWTAANSKTRVRSLIRETIILLRQEVIEDEYARRALAIAETGINAPGGDREVAMAAGGEVLKLVEKEINSQIFCSLDVLGDFIEDQFLDPLGLPPDTKTLTRKSLGQAPTIEFSLRKLPSLKTRQSEIYRKAIETIILNFIKSVLAGVITDVLNALFGCGPKSGRGENATLKSALNVVNFGSSTLSSDFFEIDLVEVAKQVSIQNIETQDVNGQIVIYKTPATLAQLQAFIEDTAKMCTPFELQQLLDGDAEYELLQHILETVTGNQIIVKSEIDPGLYNTLSFTTENIKDFFVTIGDYFSGIVEDDVEQSPLAAYCESRESPTAFGADALAIDMEEQYFELVQDKLGKINSLCDQLKNFANIQIQLERLIQNLPSMQWYDDLLQFIANLSNLLANSFSKLFEDMFDEDQDKTTRQLSEYNLYSSRMGTELFFQIFFSMRELPINQFYYDGQTVGFLTPAGWNPQRVGWGFSQGIDGDEIDFRGNFGARRNPFTDNDVYTFIWSDTRNPDDDGRPGRKIEPSRLNIPQYRLNPQKPFESWDSAYYSLKNAPSALLKRLSIHPSRVTAGELQRIEYGEPVRKIDEQTYLSTVAKRVYTYFTAEEILSPYSNWTGATFLVFGAPGYQTDKIKISYYKPEDVTETVAEFDPTSENISTEITSEVDYKVFAGTTVGGHSISFDDRSHLMVDGLVMPTNESSGIRNLYGNFSIGVPKIDYRNTRTSPSSRTSSKNRDKDVLCIQNYTQRIDTTINNTIIADVGKRRFPRYTAALIKNPFKQTDDVCVTAEEITKAQALVQSLQARLSEFFLNVLPLAPAYPSWGSVGTIKLLTDYLHRKISSDLKRKQILGSAYELIQFVKMVYPLDLEGDYASNPQISDLNTPSENLKIIIEAMLIGTLTKIQETSEYSQLGKSVFDPSTASAERYRNTLEKFYRILGDDNINLTSYGIEQQAAAATKQKIREFYDENGVTDLGMSVGVYYFPIAFQIASYLIYYNEGIKFGNRYSDTNMRLLMDVASADDNLLTALKGQLIRQFTQGFANFPITVETWDVQREVTYYSPEQVSDRIAFLDNILENYDYFIENTALLYDLSDFSDSYQQEDATIQELYSSYFSSGADGISYLNDRISQSPRRWRGDVRDAAIEQINDWFNTWIGPDEPRPNPAQQARLIQLRAEETMLEVQVRALGGLVPPALTRQLEQVRQRIREVEQASDALEFSYNRERTTSVRRAADANLPDTLRNAEDFWITILENDYKTIDVDILTSPEYFTTISSYFNSVSVRFDELFDEEVSAWVEEGDNGLQPRNRAFAPVEIQALREAGLFFQYIATLYTTGFDVAPKVLEEKTTLEQLITTNE